MFKGQQPIDMNPLNLGFHLCEENYRNPAPPITQGGLAET